MSLDAPRYKLNSSMKALRARWEEVAELWNDPVRQRFEESCWRHLEPAVTATTAAIDELSRVLAQARQDCG
jgi:hypothetical protein